MLVASWIMRVGADLYLVDEMWFDGIPMGMKHEVLDRHQKIAWDMDGTLVDGPNARFFRDYIAAHPEKDHHVVTFRNRSWANDIWEELESWGFDAHAHIKSIENCPEEIHDCYMINWRMDGAENRRRHREGPHFTRAEFDDLVRQFPLWKGLRAKEIGCTLLVDDMPSWVVAGCEEHGVEFFHAHTRIYR